VPKNRVGTLILKKMTIFFRPETTPQFNIAAEEFLLKQFGGDAFTLWRNEPAIIVGKHQNTHAEINLDVVLTKKKRFLQAKIVFFIEKFVVTLQCQK